MAISSVSQPFGIEVEHVGESVILRVTGELVAQHEAALDEAVSEAVSAGGRDLFVDLRNTTFIDSLGVRALIRGQLRARMGQYRFAVMPGRGQVFRVVKTMGLDRVLQVLDEDAGASLSPG